MTTSTKKQFTRGIIIRPDDIGVDSVEGELKIALTAKKMQVYLDGALRSIVTENSIATLTNKTLDADTNTIANLEVDNLKAGVLNTSTTLAAASDLAIPSALAVKTYVDDKTAAQNEASEITFAPVGNILATNVQTMGQELDADLSTEIAARTSADTTLQTNINNEATARALVQTNLDAHISDTTDVHAASSLTNAPVGNLAALTVQGALNELQSDVDTRATTTALNSEISRATTAENLVQTNLTTHINNTTGAHAASAISNAALGNLAATTVQGALNELQTDVDTRATSSSLAAHTGASTGVHGVTGAVVGTTDTQTLSSKTLTSPVINTPTGIVKADVGLANVDNTSDSTKNAATVTLTNKSLVDTSTSIVDSVDSTKRLLFDAAGTTGTSTTLTGTQTANRVVNLPDATDTLVGKATTDVLTNKTLTAPVIDATTYTHIATPSTPSTGSAKVYVKSDNTAYILNSTGVEVALGTGSGTSSPDTIFQLNATEDLATWSTGDNAAFLGGGVLSGAFVKETVSPLNGTASYKYTQAAGSLNDYLASPLQSVPVRFRGNTCTLVFPFLYNGSSNEIEVIFYDATNSAIIPSSVFLTGTSTTNTIFKTNITIPLTCATIRVGFMTRVLNSGKLLQFDDVLLSSDTTIYTGTSPTILTAPQTFSSETAPLVYAGSATYTIATLPNAPVGTFITYTYAASGTARTQTTTAPTQTTASMQTNGIQVFARPFNAASTAASPSTILIQIGKGMLGKDVQAYSAAAKASNSEISLDKYAINTSLSLIAGTDYGYNPLTGILTIDAGYDGTGASTTRYVGLAINTGSAVTNAYFYITASTNPALTGLNISAIAARGVNTSATSINSATSTTITYDTSKTFDTNAALNAATGIFTAPEAGYFQANANILFSSVSWAAGAYVECRLVKNGSIVSTNRHTLDATNTQNVQNAISDVVYLAKNDTLALTVLHTAGAARTLEASATYNYFSITKTSVG